MIQKSIRVAGKCRICLLIKALSIPKGLPLYTHITNGIHHCSPHTNRIEPLENEEENDDLEYTQSIVHFSICRGNTPQPQHTQHNFYLNALSHTFSRIHTQCAEDINL